MTSIGLVALEWLKSFGTVVDYLERDLPAGVEEDRVYASAMIWFYSGVEENGIYAAATLWSHCIRGMDLIMWKVAHDTH